MSAVVGLENVLRNLNREVEGVKRRSLAGLLAGGLLIMGEAKKPYNVPIDTANLRNSGYVRKAPGGEILVELGFAAAYAVYVHEDMEAHHDNGRAKYLEIPLNEKKDEVLDRVRRAAEIKA